MSDNIKSKVLSKIDSSPVFALQLDESTDISNLSQLLVYVRYVADERINEEFLFCQPLETTSKAVEPLLYTDALNCGLGAALMQEHDGKYYPVAYGSKKFRAEILHLGKGMPSHREGFVQTSAILAGKPFIPQTDH